jgi:hypothetical protein
LRKQDPALVSFTDREEVSRVRTNFLRKKLGLTNPDDELDEALVAVAEKMKGDCTRNRVTVYCLLASHFGKLSMFN